MTRRPTQNRRRKPIARPVTFSRFARTVAHVASVYITNRRARQSPPHTHTHTPANESVKKTTSEASMKKTTSEASVKKTTSKANRKLHESSEEEEPQDIVQVDFAFFDPKPGDFHGIKMLLQNYLEDKQWDLSGFADVILGQPSVGTVVKQEDDDADDNAVFAVVSALNLERYKDHKCITQFKEFILKACRDKTVKDDLRLLLGKQAHTVGLLISQRVNNLAPQLLPHLYDALFDEVSWAVEDEPTEELRSSFIFESYLLVTKVYELKNVDQKKRKGSDNEEQRIYIKHEDEIFHELCSWSFLFPLKGEQVTSHELRNYRLMGLAMALKADKVPEFRKKLHASVDES